MTTSRSGDVSAQEVPAQIERIIDRIVSGAGAASVFAEPVKSGEYTVITACEVMHGGGFGFGSGSSPAAAARSAGETEVGGGGGGGAGSRGRPIAAIVIGPDGVEIRPIVDATKIAMAGITAGISMALALRRIARARQR